MDPSQFPASLMRTCERIVKDGRFQPQEPVNIISASYHELLENKTPIIGTCLMCMMPFLNQCCSKQIHE